MKKGFIITAVVLTVLGIALIAGVFIATGFDVSVFSEGKYETNKYTPKGEFDNITVDAHTEDITFKPSEDGKLCVECRESEKVKHSVVIEDGTLKIGEKDERGLLDRLTFFGGGSESITVYLPKNEYKSLKVSVSTGDVKLDGVSADSISLSVTTGHTDVCKTDCKGAFSVSVTTGKTVFTDVKCGSFRSEGATGDVTLKNTVVSDGIFIERSTGDVRFEDSDAGEIKIETTTGDVSGTLRSGKLFSVKTATGDIDVPNTTGGSCIITTTTGDVEISVE